MERNTNPWIVKNLKEFQFFHCSDCEFKNLDHTELMKHCLDYRGHIINDFLLYTCPECDYKSVSKMEFIKHAVNNHEKSESLIESFHIIQEVPKEKQQSPHKCDACRSIFKSESDLTIHILGFHRRLVRQLPCCAELLGNEFVCHYIQSHSNVSRVEKVRILKQFNLIPCLKCNDLFSRKEDLEQHELKVHSVIEAPKPKFSKEVRVSLPKLSKSEISKHTQRTIKESTYNSTNSESSKIYKCEICELCLSSDKLLKMHKAMVHPKYGITAKTKNKHRNGNFLNRKGRKLIPSFSEVKSIYDQG